MKTLVTRRLVACRRSLAAACAMIHYDINKWWGLSLCLQLYGSVLPKALPYVVLSVVMCAVMLAIDESTDMVAMARIEGGAQVCH